MKHSKYQPIPSTGLSQAADDGDDEYDDTLLIIIQNARQRGS